MRIYADKTRIHVDEQKQSHEDDSVFVVLTKLDVGRPRFKF